MAENADVDLYKFFLEEIPSLYNQAQRTLHCTDINLLEFFERRLDDHIHVIKAVIDQCQQMTEMRVNEELIELLLTVHRQVNSLLVRKRAGTLFYICTAITIWTWICVPCRTNSRWPVAMQFAPGFKLRV
jgi:hypothetical protein